MRKPDFYLCKNKGADQLLCFRYSDSTFPPLPGRFVSDMVGTPEDQFSRVAAHLSKDVNLIHLNKMRKFLNN